MPMNQNANGTGNSRCAKERTSCFLLAGDMDKRRQPREIQSPRSDFGPSLRARRSEDALKIRGSRKLIRSWQHDTNQTAGQQRHHPTHARKCWAARWYQVQVGQSGPQGASSPASKSAQRSLQPPVGLAAEIEIRAGAARRTASGPGAPTAAHNKARRTRSQRRPDC